MDIVSDKIYFIFSEEFVLRFELFFLSANKSFPLEKRFLLARLGRELDDENSDKN